MTECILCSRLQCELRPICAELGRAQFDTLRLRLLRVAAIVQQSVRRFLVKLPHCFGYKRVFSTLLNRLMLPLPAS